MTLHETIQSVYGLTVAGYINREKMTLTAFEGYIKNLFKGNTKLSNRVVVEIALPDGWWLCQIIRFADRRDGFNYEIPETREQEQRIWKALTA